MHRCGLFICHKYSQSSFPMFTSFVRKRFLIFIWKCNAFSWHIKQTPHPLSHSIHQTTVVKKKERRRERETHPTYSAVCLNETHITMDRMRYSKHPGRVMLAQFPLITEGNLFPKTLWFNRICPGLFIEHNKWSSCYTYYE